MSEQWTFYFDPAKCIGCHACSVACDVQNDRDTDDEKWRVLKHEPTGEFPDYEETAVSMSCFHCGDAPCEKVCPTGAIFKRDADGIVTVDQEKCIGCHYCGWACPYGVPTYNGNNDDKMSKCHLCLGEGAGDGHGKPPRQRPEEGGEAPNCVNNCVTDALHAGPVSEMMELASDAAVQRYVDGNERAFVESVELSQDDSGD